MENSLKITTGSESKMLKYCKVILEKMSFDKKLVRKEYRKSIRWLTHSEYESLRIWVRAKVKRDVK